MVDDYISDGGWWNMFSNLVIKYGLIPKSAMKETFQSEDSDDMNKILNNCLQACANFIHKNRKKNKKELEKVREKTMKQIYSTLVKFLGEPPTSFRWSYTTEDGDPVIISDLEPKQFMSMVMPGIDIKDFVVITHIPGNLCQNKQYEVKYTNNIYEGDNFKFLNLTIKELSKYSSKSILSGFPVWFAADVSKDFNPYHSTLDDRLVDEKSIFGANHTFNKEDKITFHNLAANHAMCLTGINLDHKNKPEAWQVENSWGLLG